MTPTDDNTNKAGGKICYARLATAGRYVLCSGENSRDWKYLATETLAIVWQFVAV